jgi:hypothetical protein
MSNRPISAATLRFQADRCETAAHKRCKCRCGGMLHGIRHSEEWIEEQVQLDKVRHQLASGQIDWVGYAGFEAYL